MSLNVAAEVLGDYSSPLSGQNNSCRLIAGRADIEQKNINWRGHRDNLVQHTLPSDISDDGSNQADFRSM